MRHGNPTKTAALYLMILLIGASALAFGSVQTWSSEWLRFGAVLIVGLLLWRGSPRKLFSAPSGTLVLPGVILVAFAFLQTVPLPAGVVRALSPRAAALYEQTVPAGGGEHLSGFLLDQARSGDVVVEGNDFPLAQPDRGDSAVGRSLSIYPQETRESYLSWITPLLFFLAASRIARDHTRRYRLLLGIAAWAGVLGVLAVLQRTPWSENLLWAWKSSAPTLSVVPYVNPNHYAGFVGMATLAAIGLLLALLSGRTGSLDRESIRAALMDRDWALPRVIAIGMCATLGTIGLLLSRSRGGYLALAAGLVALVLARRLRSVFSILALAVVSGGIATGLVGFFGAARAGLDTTPFVYSQTDPSTIMRGDAWAKTLRVFLDHPWVGTGLGTFEWAFASYQRRGEWMRFRHAHNDYLQLLSETGVVGALLLLWALWVLLRLVIVPALRGNSERARWTTAAAAAALFAMLVHTVVDFNLQIPANAALFSVMAGVLAAAARDRRPNHAEARSP